MIEYWRNWRKCCAQRLGSVTGEALPYFLGLPLVGGARNYSRADAAVAEACVALLAAFAKTGEPAPAPAPARADERHADAVAWPRYELNTQLYLSIGETYCICADTNRMFLLLSCRWLCYCGPEVSLRARKKE